jgi:hypothetical protein
LSSVQEARGSGQSGEQWPTFLQLKHVSPAWAGLRAGVVERRVGKAAVPERAAAEEEEEGVEQL